MSHFKLTLTDSTDDYDLYFKIFETPIARKWSDEILKSYPLYEVDRFTNWPHSSKNKEYYLVELNKQIEIVNSYYDDKIPIRLTEDSDQETMNQLHKYFEELRGPLVRGSRWFNVDNEVIKNAIVKFNVLIHEYEHICFNEEAVKITNHPYATIVGTFSGERHSLAEEDYGHFTFKWRFGTVYINYCEVGKPLLDVFKDNDNVVGDDNIRPLKFYSADFQIKFGPDTSDEVYNNREQNFWSWYDQRENYFASIGLFRSNKLSLGLIPVASLDVEKSKLSGLSQMDIINKISPYQQIKATCIK